MSTVDELPPPDPEWEDLIGRLGDIPEPEDVVDVTKLSDPELVEQLALITVELNELGEPINAKTERGHDLHSIRGAIIIEQRRRRTR